MLSRSRPCPLLPTTGTLVVFRPQPAACILCPCASSTVTLFAAPWTSRLRDAQRFRCRRSRRRFPSFPYSSARFSSQNQSAAALSPSTISTSSSSAYWFVRRARSFVLRRFVVSGVVFEVRCPVGSVFASRSGMGSRYLDSALLLPSLSRLSSVPGATALSPSLAVPSPAACVPL